MPDIPTVALYTIEDGYISYLRTHESKILYNKPDLHQRPYIWISLQINGFQYMLPLSSSKEHTGKKVNNQLTTKIKDENDDVIAYIQHHNMIPCSDEHMTLVDMDWYKNCDKSYFDLLEKERLFIRSNIESIIVKSEKVYKRRATVEFYQTICLDFPLLETKSLEFE
ncbi:MAG: type III toxin-antitoxin system ToxN/AbiQ family toxin [Enterococcus mundtii]|nr:type III toxin-antitoxin system ToxN/AbiQ family toxin [Enterococcus mundtii]